MYTGKKDEEISLRGHGARTKLRRNKREERKSRGLVMRSSVSITILRAALTCVSLEGRRASLCLGEAGNQSLPGDSPAPQTQTGQRFPKY